MECLYLASQGYQYQEPLRLHALLQPFRTSAHWAHALLCGNGTVLDFQTLPTVPKCRQLPWVTLWVNVAQYNFRDENERFETPSGVHVRSYEPLMVLLHVASKLDTEWHCPSLEGPHAHCVPIFYRDKGCGIATAVRPHDFFGPPGKGLCHTRRSSLDLPSSLIYVFRPDACGLKRYMTINIPSNLVKYT